MATFKPLTWCDSFRLCKACRAPLMHIIGRRSCSICGRGGPYVVTLCVTAPCLPGSGPIADAATVEAERRPCVCEALGAAPA